jgi:Tc5 transposase DNA-binding domain
VYIGRPVPKFLNRWLDKFKKRHGIKERRRYGEDTSTQVNKESKKTIEEI